MAYKISAEENNFSHDEDHQTNADYESTHLSDFDKQILMMRVRQKNKRWIAKQVIGSIVIAYILYSLLMKLLTSFL